MKNYRPRRPSRLLAIAALALSAATLSVFVVVPVALEAHVQEFRVSVAAVAAR